VTITEWPIILPVFRFNLLAITFYGLHCLNVYLFKSMKFNYRLIFKYKMHYTHMGEKLRYLTMIVLVFLVLWLYYLIAESDITKLKNAIRVID